MEGEVLHNTLHKPVVNVMYYQFNLQCFTVPYHHLSIYFLLHFNELFLNKISTRLKNSFRADRIHQIAKQSGFDPLPILENILPPSDFVIIKTSLPVSES
jgi:hypothetical protein